MRTSFNIDKLPELKAPDEIRVIGKAVSIAGLWADSYLEKALTDFQTIEKLNISVEEKGGADIVTMLDPLSENIMAQIMQRGGYDGGIFGEEGMIINPTHKKTLVLDGIDGTEAAMSRPAGLESPYGPSAGIFSDDNGVIKPIEGAVYLPRQNKGFVGSTKSGTVIEFEIKKSGNVYEVTGTKEISAFNQDRTDIKYILAFFLEENEKFPSWFGNLCYNANRQGHQNVLHSSGSQVDYLAKLIEECGDRSLNIGTSAAIGSRGTRLHDIMGLAPAILVLGGVIGNYEGAKLGIDLEFIPDEFQEGSNTLVHIKQKKQIPNIPIGPVISAHNENIYQKVREFMRSNGK